MLVFCFCFFCFIFLFVSSEKSCLKNVEKDFLKYNAILEKDSCSFCNGYNNWSLCPELNLC